MYLVNPLTDPIFWPTVRVCLLLFILGFGLVLYFGRKDLKASLTGELGKRFLGWLLIAPLFMLAAFVGGIVAAAILLFFFFRIVSEYVTIVGVKRDYAIYLYSLIPVTIVTAQFISDLFFTLPAFSILLLSLIPILTRKIDDLYGQMSFAGRGYLYLIWSVAHLILLKQLAGTGMVVLVGIGVALSDVMQYTFGKLLGKHIICPEVNPRKAWEGLVGDFLGASLAVYLMQFAIPPEFTLPYLIALVVLIGVGSAWGDLAPSLVKRVAGVKDWGHIIPGHGGLLDRANSMVIVIPLVYYFTYLVLVYGQSKL
jgi:phosphatidate cytidylyltransferase